MNDAENRLVFLVSQIEKVLIEARTNQELLRTIILKLNKSLPPIPPVTEKEVQEYFESAKEVAERDATDEIERELREFLPDYRPPGEDDRLN
jgi:hypothetical protein